MWRARRPGKNSPARRPGSAAGLSNAAYRAGIHGWAAVEAGKPREQRSNAAAAAATTAATAATAAAAAAGRRMQE